MQNEKNFALISSFDQIMVVYGISHSNKTFHGNCRIVNNRSHPRKLKQDKSLAGERYYRKGSDDERKPAPWSARYLLGYCLMLTWSNWVQSVVID